MALHARSQRALEAFCTKVNIEKPHPLDAQRWRAFIVAVRLDGGKVDYASARALLGEAGIDRYAIDCLIDSLDDGLELLDLWAIHSTLSSSGGLALCCRCN
jgi:hypothetical protein